MTAGRRGAALAETSEKQPGLEYSGGDGTLYAVRRVVPSGCLVLHPLGSFPARSLPDPYPPSTAPLQYVSPAVIESLYATRPPPTPACPAPELP